VGGEAEGKMHKVRKYRTLLLTKNKRSS